MEFVLSEMIDQVMTARASHRPLYIRGGGTKQFYGEPSVTPANGGVLDMSAYTGVVNYEPSELVVTARAGTPLAEIEELLAANRQMLAFEPPRFGPASTIGIESHRGRGTAAFQYLAQSATAGLRLRMGSRRRHRRIARASVGQFAGAQKRCQDSGRRPHGRWPGSRILGQSS